MRTRVNPWPRSVGGGSSVAVSCGIGHRCGSDLGLLWLWCRLAAVGPIQALAWELTYAIGVTLKRKKKKKKSENKKTKKKKRILISKGKTIKKKKKKKDVKTNKKRKKIVF